MSDVPSIVDVLQDDSFSAIDVALRRGEHIDHELDRAEHHFLERYQDALKKFYSSYDADLVYDPDGYWVLVPHSTSPLRTRPLNRAEMVVGLALAHLRMDPAILASSMTVTRQQLLADIEGLFGGHERIEAILGRGRGSRGASQAQAKIRKSVDAALISLDRLGFVDQESEDRLVLRAALGRFIDIARDRDPTVALETLTKRCRAMAGLLDTIDTDEDETPT